MNKALFGLALAALLIPVAHADINVGVILSQTGGAASLGIPERNTVAMWPDEIAGHKLNVTVLDDGTDPSAAAAAARKLLQEEKVDIIIGPSITPTSLAVLQVAGAAETPVLTLGGGKAIIEPQEGARRWAFKMVPDESIPVRMILQHMKDGEKSKLAVVAVTNAYGEIFNNVMQEIAPEYGVEIVGVEHFNPGDSSFAAQALKIISKRPDAVFIAAVGTPGATPHIELKRRGFKGTIYQTQAIANQDFLRVGGQDVVGSILPVSPLLVAEQLPDSNVVKQTAVDYVSRYEAKHGENSRSLFGGMAWDAFLFLQNAVPMALKDAEPGTAEFRVALRDALEQTKELIVSQGVYNLSETDHSGADERSQVLVEITGDGWRYIDN